MSRVDDGATITVFLNGSLAMTGAANGAPSHAGATGITLGGNNRPHGGSPLEGKLDQLRIYDEARPASQICRDAGESGY